MGTGIINTAITGIQVAQLGLQTTSHNITNASTAGFNRQRVVQASNIAMATGAGYIGQGAHVSTIARMYDSFLSGQVNSAQTTSSQLETYYAQVSQIDNMLADANSGVSSALQDFFTGVQQVSANPSQLSTRQAMISSAQSLVARYQSLDGRISELYDGVNNQITTVVGSINSYSEQIASLNQSIVDAESAVSQPANDLRDQRDQLVAELNKLVKVTTTSNSNGSLNVFIGTGQPLVVGSQVSEMTAEASKADPSRIVAGIKTISGTTELPESMITGGSLGGLVSFRSESLDRVANDIGRSAASLALTFNAQNALGQDLLGQSQSSVVGTFTANFFTPPQPTVFANGNNKTAATVSASLVSPSIDGAYTLALDASGTTYTLTRQSDGVAWTGMTLSALQTAVPASEGLTLTSATIAPGSSTQISSPAAVGANFYTKLTSSDYRLSYDGTNYTMTRLSDNQPLGPAATIDSLSKLVAASEGFSFSLTSGSFPAGDSFVIQPTRSAARNISVNAAVAADARLIAAAMPIRTAAESTNTGTGKISTGSSTWGFGTPAISAAGVTMTYHSAENSLTLTGLPAGANVIVTVGTTSTAYPGPNIPYTSGATIAFAGVRFDITGNLNNGDVFTLGKNSSGGSDGRNALVLGALQTQNTMIGKTASYESAYAQLVSSVGNKTREISVKNDAQSTLLTQSTAARDSLSGVNLDEEAANLMRYQQAYQAAAKVIDIGSKLFDTLLAIKS